MVTVGVTLSVPLAAFEPVHPPLAVQDAAFLLDQTSVDGLPGVSVVSLVDRVSVGATAAIAGFTVTATDVLLVPPAPAHASV